MIGIAVKRDIAIDLVNAAFQVNIPKHHKISIKSAPKKAAP